MPQVKVGDLVTIKLKDSHTSNTYKIHHILDDFAYLNTPAMEHVLIPKKIEELNQVEPVLPNSTERVISFINKNKSLLLKEDRDDLDMLMIYFTMYKTFSKRQLMYLSRLSGLVAQNILDSDVEKAIDLVNTHYPILDNFNRTWYHNFEKIFNKRITNIYNKKRIAIFNMAGFVLANKDS